MGGFKISVIIPVFNAEKFIERAVQSVLIQPEVDELILIDDGSSDTSYPLIKNLALAHPKVKVLTHSNKINKGPAATRNLGIKEAKNEWIAFLDADDFYLVDRFKYATAIIRTDSSVDGIYEAIAPEEEADNPVENKLNDKALLTLEENIYPKDLFFSMSPIGHKGLFSGDGLLVKKKLLLELGLFNENLRIGEDILLWLKLSIAGKLVGGKLTSPIAVFTRHSANTTFGGNVAHHLIPVFYSLLDWQHPNFQVKHKTAIIDALLFVLFNKLPDKKLSIFSTLCFKYPYFISSKSCLNNFKYILKKQFNK